MSSAAMSVVSGLSSLSSRRPTQRRCHSAFSSSSSSSSSSAAWRPRQQGPLALPASRALHQAVRCEADTSTSSTAAASRSSGNTVDTSKAKQLIRTAEQTHKVDTKELARALFKLRRAGASTKEGMLERLAGSSSPGNTWMLLFTVKADKVKAALKDINEADGSFFPITGVQRFDAQTGEIENGVYFGPVGNLRFNGNFEWNEKTAMLAFDFTKLSLKLGPLGPFSINLGGFREMPKTEGQKAKPGPFFIFNYVDDEIAIAQGKAGGLAIWVRCENVQR
eukprot:jgi/Chlat1/6761/Chrsp50S06483